MSHIAKDNDSFEVLNFEENFFVSRQTQTETTVNILGANVDVGVDGLCKGCQMACGDEKKRDRNVESLNGRIQELEAELGLMKVRNEGLVRQLANNTDSYYEQEIEELMMQLTKEN